MKRIVLVSTSFPGSAFHSGQEAAGSFVYFFALELSRKAEVTVVAPGDESQSYHQGPLHIRYFPVPRLPLSLLKPGNPLHWRAITMTMNSGQRAVKNAVLNNKPDHVIALWALPSGYWAKAACAESGVPYSVWALGSDIWSLGKIPVIRQVLRKVLRNSSHCFGDGYKLASDVEAISGKPCGFLPSCRKLPVSTKKELATEPPYKLAFLGRWHRNKGIDLLLKSLRLLSKEDWSRISEVRIHGGGPLSDLVHSEGALLKSEGHPIEIGGYLDLEEAASLYNWADYVLIPSRIESIPVVFSDAMQSMCPVIVTPVGDLPRLIKENMVGVSARAVTSEAYAEAVRIVLSDAPGSFSQGLHSVVKGFVVEESVRRMHEALFS